MLIKPTAAEPTPCLVVVLPPLVFSKNSRLDSVPRSVELVVALVPWFSLLAKLKAIQRPNIGPFDARRNQESNPNFAEAWYDISCAQ